MAQTELGTAQVLLRDFFGDLGEVGAHTTEQLDDSVVEGGGDAGGLEDGLSKVGLADPKSKLLLLGALCRGQVGREEGLQLVGDFNIDGGHNVVEGLFSRGEWLEGLQSYHLGEAFKGVDRLHDFGEVSTCRVVLFLFEETVA